MQKMKRPVKRAPKWLVERMEKLKKLPPPTLEEVETSFRAGERARAHYERTGQRNND